MFVWVVKHRRSGQFLRLITRRWVNTSWTDSLEKAKKYSSLQDIGLDMQALYEGTSGNPQDDFLFSRYRLENDGTYTWEQLKQISGGNNK